MEELEDAYLGALEADRVRRGESSTRPLDAVMQDLGLDR
jgi:predicted DNA-binding protein